MQAKVGAAVPTPGVIVRVQLVPDLSVVAVATETPLGSVRAAGMAGGPATSVVSSVKVVG